MRITPCRTFLRTALALVAVVPLSLPAVAPAGREHESAVKLEGSDYYHYYAEKIPLDCLGNRVAVRFKDSRVSLSAARSLASRVAVASTDAMSLASGVIVLELARGQDAATARGLLAASPDVAWVVPVYRPEQAGNLWVATDEILVRVKSAEQSGRPRFAKDARVLSYKRLVSTSDTYVLTVAPGEAALALANEFAESGLYEWAAPNAVQTWQRLATTDDPLLGRQWHLENLGGGLNGNPAQNSVAGADAKVKQAWDINPGGSPSIVVAVIDDGPELAHPDLAPNVYVNPGEIAGNGIDDDGNGYIDDVSGWDFSAGVPGDNDGGNSLDTDEHGTSVAGVIAARGNNAIGVAGAAYNVRWFPSRIFAGGAPTNDAGIAAAVNFASGRSADGLATCASAADITNNSWGGGSPSAVVTDAFAWGGSNGRGGKGTIHLIASGNNGSSAPNYPGSLASTLPNVLCIGASNDVDDRAYYSQYGAGLDLLAPSGGGSYSIVTTDRTGALGYDPGSYAGETNDATGFNGTSSATPLAAGVVGLMLSERPSLTAVEVRRLLRATADRISFPAADYSGIYPSSGALPASAGWDVHRGFGRINAYAALRGLTVPEIAVHLGGPELSVTSTHHFETDNRSSLTEKLQLRNQSLLPLAVENIALTPGPITVDTSALVGGVLAPGETALLPLVFLPQEPGSGMQTLTFLTDDADEYFYTLQLNWTSLPVSARGRVVEDYNGDGLAQDTEPGVAGCRVFLDADGDLLLDAAGGASVDVPKSIPDGVAAGIDSTISVATPGVVGAMRVALNITHTWVGDLTITLTSPSGTTATLFARSGGDGDNLTGTIFDDASAIAIGDATPPFNGAFRPASPLSAFLGEPLSGTWTLRVADAVLPDPGTLTSWSLEFLSETATLADASGYYHFINLPPGGYYAVVDVPNVWIRSPNSASFHNFVIEGADEFGPFNFGLGRLGSVYGRIWHDSDLSGTEDAHEGGVPDVLVYSDPDLSGTMDDNVSGTYSAMDLPLPINDVATTTSVIALPTGMPSGVTVTIGSLAHTWVSDLTLELVHPDGTVVLLSRRRGSSGDNYTNTVFDDAAATSITAGVPPFTGTFRPEGSLASLAGKNMAGTWQLRVRDGFVDDTGTLNAWSLTIAGGGEARTTTDAQGYFAFHDEVAGQVNLVVVPPVGWSAFSPLIGKLSSMLTEFDTSTGMNFALVSDIRASDLSIQSIDLGSGNTLLEGLALPVQLHRVQGRPNLMTGDWTDLGTFTPNLDGTFLWQDPAPAPTGNYFYRIVTP